MCDQWVWFLLKDVDTNKKSSMFALGFHVLDVFCDQELLDGLEDEIHFGEPLHGFLFVVFRHLMPVW